MKKRYIIIIIAFLFLSLFVKKIVFQNTEINTSYKNKKSFRIEKKDGCISKFGYIVIKDSIGEEGYPGPYSTNKDGKWQPLNNNEVVYRWGVRKIEKGIWPFNETGKTKQVKYSFVDPTTGFNCVDSVNITNPQYDLDIEIHVTKPIRVFNKMWMIWENGKDYPLGSLTDQEQEIKVYDPAKPEVKTITIDKDGASLGFEVSYSNEDSRHISTEYNLVRADGSSGDSAKENWKNISERRTVNIFEAKKYKLEIISYSGEKNNNSNAVLTTIMFDVGALNDSGKTICYDKNNSSNICNIENISEGTESEIKDKVNNDNEELQQNNEKPLYTDEEKEYASEKIVCDEEMKNFIHTIWEYVVVLSPIGLIVLCTFDFLKATFKDDAEAVKKASSATVKRVLALILLLALPLILKTIFVFVGIDFCF